MARITIDVDDVWLKDARAELGTDSDEATINAALRTFALRRQATEIVAAFDGVDVDFSRSPDGWRYAGGRDLSQLEADARASFGSPEGL